MTVIHKYQAIWKAVSSLREGQIATYGEVAKRAGLNRHARLVSRALKEAPDELKLPWFRVVGSGPKISLPLDSDAGKLQLTLLQQEGHIINKGRIKPNPHVTQPQVSDDLDYILWGPEA